MFFKNQNSKSLLDFYPCDGYAYSLQKIKSTINYVIRVQRSSDNSQKDFKAKEITNGTLTNWVGGSNNGFVKTWYDQSGNNRNLTFLNLTNLIVKNGLLLIDNGTPYIEYTGNTTKNDYSLSNTSGLNSTNASLFTTYNSNDTTAGMVFQSGNVSGSTFVGSLQLGSSASIYESSGSPICRVNSILLTPQTRANLHSKIVLNKDVLVSFVNVNFSSAHYTGNKSLPYVYTTNAVSQSLKAKEFIVYNSDQSANRINIENDIKSRYNI